MPRVTALGDPASRDSACALTSITASSSVSSLCRAAWFTWARIEQLKQHAQVVAVAEVILRHQLMRKPVATAHRRHLSQARAPVPISVRCCETEASTECRLSVDKWNRCAVASADRDLCTADPQKPPLVWQTLVGSAFIVGKDHQPAVPPSPAPDTPEPPDGSTVLHDHFASQRRALAESPIYRTGTSPSLDLGRWNE